jgi:hypothetical protein
MSLVRLTLTVFSMIVLAGCDNDTDSAECDSIRGGDSQVSTTGPVTDAQAAVDGNLNSFAPMNLGQTVDEQPAADAASIRATAQEGIVYPAGSRAGVFVTMNNPGPSDIALVRTYLDDQLVETASPGNTISEPAQRGTDAQRYFGLTTSAPFDAVEFSASTTPEEGAAPPDYRVYEICSDGEV